MIAINNINYSIKGKKILEDISFEINKGEFAVIIGPNGAGKSTLLKLILNLLPLQTGNILINKVEHSQFLKDYQVAYLPQIESFNNQFPLKVIDLVLMGRSSHRRILSFFKKEDKEIAYQSLEMLNIEKLSNKQISNLSGGEFQRVLLARALATESEYIFLDEPEAGIDHVGIISFYELLYTLNKNGKTIVTVSHDLERLSDFCSLVVCLNRTMHCHQSVNQQNKRIIHQLTNNANGRN